MIELIATIIGGQTVVVERMLGLAPNDGAMPMSELYTHSTSDKALRAMDISGQVLVQRTVPLTVIDQPCILCATISLKWA